MLRFIIGISLIAVVIMIIRRLSDGKMLKKHQHAIWLLIPLYMIVSPFLRINIPVAEELSFIIPSKTVTVAEAVDSGDVTPLEITEQNVTEDVISDQVVLEQISDSEIIAEKNDVRIANEVRKPVDIWKILNCIYFSVAAVLILLLTLYNVGFILFCRRTRKYVGRDPESGLAIYGIRHRGVPFLLFNKIYVDGISGKYSEYAICHEACHYRQGDFIWVIVRYLVLILNWYNPLIWIAFILSGRDCELACDEEVIRVLGEDSSTLYAATLLDMADRRSKNVPVFSVSTGMKSGYKMMKNRIVSIMHPSKTSYKVLVMSLAALIAVSGLSVLEPEAAEADVITLAGAEEILVYDENDVEAPVQREAPFDYSVRVPSVVKLSDTEKEITFYRDGAAFKGKFITPQGKGPYKTVVMRNEYGSDISDMESMAKIFAEKGYAALMVENTHDADIYNRTITGSVNNHAGDIYLEQILDIHAVIDELRYLPDVDTDSVYLWGAGAGGMLMALTCTERQYDISGMILYNPNLSEAQYMKLSDEPKYVARIYDMLSECYVPTVIMEHKSSGKKASSAKAAGCMPDGEMIILEADIWTDDDIFKDQIAYLSVDVFESWK